MVQNSLKIRLSPRATVAVTSSPLLISEGQHGPVEGQAMPTEREDAEVHKDYDILLSSGIGPANWEFK